MAKKNSGCEFATLQKTQCHPACEPVRLDGSELQMFDSIAQEHVKAHGTEILYWRQDLDRSQRDPLYDEPVDRSFRGPYKVYGFVEYAAGQPETTEQGMRVTWAGTVWIPRVEFEQSGAGSPLEGDVLQYWNVPWFGEHGVNSEEVPGRGYYFDVVNADDDGHVFDSAAFVGFKLEVRRRTEFTPERRLEG